jgi:hypothetical protein
MKKMPFILVSLSLVLAAGALAIWLTRDLAVVRISGKLADFEFHLSRFDYSDEFRVTSAYGTLFVRSKSGPIRSLDLSCLSLVVDGVPSGRVNVALPAWVNPETLSIGDVRFSERIYWIFPGNISNRKFGAVELQWHEEKGGSPCIVLNSTWQ